MSFAIHGGVTGRQAISCPAYPRYVAVLDVLGMKTWLQQRSAQEIAEYLDEALVACDQSSTGITRDGISYGPVIGVTHFSDTLLAWSPDDSWSSFAILCGAVNSILCGAVNSIVAVALYKGVPLRGAIAAGDVVCQPRILRSVGSPIAEAFLWSEKERPYRSIGVDITPSTIQILRNKSINDPIPDYWRFVYNGVDDRVINSQRLWSPLLIWHLDLLFANHWQHGIFNRRNPKDMFLRRDLQINENESDSVQRKIEEMSMFFEANSRNGNLENILDIERQSEHPHKFDLFDEQQRECIRLCNIRRQRENLNA